MNRIARSPRLSILGLGIVLVVLGLVLPRQDWLSQGSVALTLSIAATGLGIALGLAGEYLLGISFVVAAGAYPTAVLTSVFGWSFWPAALVGVVCGAVVGLIVSLPGLRISQFYFGMVGFFMVFLIPSVVEMLAMWTNGSKGLAVFDRIEAFGIPLDAHGIFILAAIALTVTLFVVLNVRMSPWSVSMRRMRDAPHALAAAGTPVWRIRFATYLLVSILAGLSGAIYSHINVFLQPGQFAFNMTTLILAAVIVGGSRSLFGPSIGLVILYIGPRLIFNIEGIADIVYGTVVLVSVLLFRGGVVQAVRDAAAAVRRARSGRRPAVGSGAAAGAGAADDAPATLSTDAPALVDLLIGFRPSRIEPLVVAVTAVRKRFGGVHALDFGDADSVRVQTGRVTLLLGPNGSGKTSLLNAITGLVHADAGTVTSGERDISLLPVAAVAQTGLSRSFQAPLLPDELSPVDLFSASISQLHHVSYLHWLLWAPAASRRYRQSQATARAIAAAAGLSAAAEQPCVGLTSGQRRLVDVVCALISRSSIVLLDEPAAGLSDPERKLLAATIRGLADRGLGFLVVEHDLELALSLADTVVVMAAGRPVVTGTPDEIQASPTVRHVLLGAPA